MHKKDRQQKRHVDPVTRRLFRDPQKRKAWALYQLALEGRSLAEVGREHGVKRQTIYAVWRHPYPRMEKLVADALGVRPDDLFPERYDADGLPNRRMGRPPKKHPVTTGKNNTRATSRNGSAQDAA